MAITHSWVTQLSNQGQEDEPLLDLVKDARESVSSLVNLHVFQGLHQLLDLVLHFEGFGLLPSVVLVTDEDLLADTDVVPEHFHVTTLGSDALDLLVAAFDPVGITELHCRVAVVFNLNLEVLDLRVDAIKFDESLFAATIIFIELALSQLLSEELHLFLELLDLIVVLLGLRANKRSHLLLDVLRKLLEVIPVVKKLLGLRDL